MCLSPINLPMSLMLLAQPKNLEEQEKKIFLRSSFDPLALSDLVPMVAYLRLMVLSEEHP